MSDTTPIVIGIVVGVSFIVTVVLIVRRAEIRNFANLSSLRFTNFSQTRETESETFARNNELAAQHYRRRAMGSPEGDEVLAMQLFNPSVHVVKDTNHVNTDDVCVVCLEPLHVPKVPLAHLDCAHVMHDACLRQWIVRDSQHACPVCRSPSAPMDLSSGTLVSADTDAFV